MLKVLLTKDLVGTRSLGGRLADGDPAMTETRGEFGWVDFSEDIDELRVDAAAETGQAFIIELQELSQCKVGFRTGRPLDDGLKVLG